MRLKCRPYLLLDGGSERESDLPKVTQPKWPPQLVLEPSRDAAATSTGTHSLVFKGLWGCTPKCPQSWVGIWWFYFFCCFEFFFSPWTTSYYLNEPIDHPKGFLNVWNWPLVWLLSFRDLHEDHHREAQPINLCREGAFEIPPPVFIILSILW